MRQPRNDIRGANSISTSSAVLAQRTAASPYTLQWAATFPLKIAYSHGGSGPLSNAWFLGPTRVNNLNGLAGFAELTPVAIATAAIRPNNV